MPAVLHEDGICRCKWCGTDPVYVAYHDTEWGVPEYDSRALFEKLQLDGFQAGLSWITILRKREAFRKAFDDFNPEKMARYKPAKLERLMNDAGIVRNRLKIEASVSNAQAYLAIPDFSAYLWNFMDGRPLQNRLRGMKDVPAIDAAGGEDFEGHEKARLPFCRPHHRLCLHAGLRAGERPHDRLPPP